MTKLESKITIAELRAFYPALAAVAETGLRNPLDPDQAAWLDGPAFAKWLRTHGLQPQNKLGESVARAVRRWREGDAVNLGTADEILTDLGYHLSELPDELWRHRPNRRAMPIADGAVREQIVKERLAGTRIIDLVKRYGVSDVTIRRWVQESKHKSGIGAA